MRRLALGASTVALLGACSTIPDVEYRYYPARMTLTVSVTQAVSCSADGTTISVGNAPAAAPAYASDLSKAAFTIKVRDIGGSFRTFADTENTFNFTEDGRLVSVNQSTTGQGETAIKSAVTLAAALIGGGGPPPAAPAAPAAPVTTACATISKLGGTDKPVTLTYGKIIDYAQTDKDTPYDLDIAPASKAIYSLIQSSSPLNSLPKLAVIIDKPTPISSAVAIVSSGSDIPLTLQNTANVKIEFTSAGATYASSNVVAPMSGTYTVPIPKAALFGKQSFQLTLTDSGAIKTIDYGTLSGATGALNAANSVATTAEPSATTQAASVKAQADLIVQQQRLVRCQTKPAACE